MSERSDGDWGTACGASILKAVAMDNGSDEEKGGTLRRGSRVVKAEG